MPRTSRRMPPRAVAGADRTRSAGRDPRPSGRSGAARASARRTRRWRVSCAARGCHAVTWRSARRRRAASTTRSWRRPGAPWRTYWQRRCRPSCAVSPGPSRCAGAKPLASMDALRWVRPLQGIVALLGGEVVPGRGGGVKSGRTTRGHRFMSGEGTAGGEIEIASADDYEDKLRAARVILRAEERRRIILDGAKAAAAEAGLALIEDEALLAENAGLTEWPVPLLGRFDEAFLEVPPEVIRLAMKTHQKYFSVSIPPRHGEGDQPQAGGGGVAARRSPDPRLRLRRQYRGAGRRRADRRRQRKGARRPPRRRAFLLGAGPEDGAGGDAPEAGRHRLPREARHGRRQGGARSQAGALAGGGGHRILPGKGRGTAGTAVEGARGRTQRRGIAAPSVTPPPPACGWSPSPFRGGSRRFAALAERAALLAKADLVSAMVGEFPELQGVMGGYYAEKPPARLRKSPPPSATTTSQWGRMTKCRPRR